MSAGRDETILKRLTSVGCADDHYVFHCFCCASGSCDSDRSGSHDVGMTREPKEGPKRLMAIDGERLKERMEYYAQSRSNLHREQVFLNSSSIPPAKLSDQITPISWSAG
jgi:hypothetical protein